VNEGALAHWGTVAPPPEKKDRLRILRYSVIPVVLVQQQRILCITHTVEHNYISPSSTVGIQLHVSALCMGHLQVDLGLL
jgi:hypothetical protein